jgi:metal binding Ada-like protein
MDMDHIACYRTISTRDARFDGRLFGGVKTTGIYCRADADDRRPSPAELSARSEGWRPWRAYAALHLWAAGARQPALSGKADAREAA